MSMDARARSLPQVGERPVMASEATYLSPGGTSMGWVATSTPLEWSRDVKAIAVTCTSFERGMGECRLGSATGRIVALVAAYVHCYLWFLDDVSEEDFPVTIYAYKAQGYSHAVALHATALSHPKPLAVLHSAVGPKGFTQVLGSRSDSIGLGTGGEGSGAVLGPGQVFEASNVKSSRGCYCWSDSESPEDQYFQCGNTSYGSGQAAMVVGPRMREVHAL